MNLTTGTVDQTFAHPLVASLHTETMESGAPVTRISVAMKRVVGFLVTTNDGHLSVTFRLPRNATGALADKLIVVDPGHGGFSTGAVGRGPTTVYEKDVALAIALKLRQSLEACGARVVMTRDKDVFISLSERTHIANSLGADLFVSIHNDSNGRANSASGTSTYYHMSEPNCRALAQCVHREVKAVTGLPSRGVLSDGTMYAHGFEVLRDTTMPAILVEVAYINNATDRRKLVDPDFQQRVADAICRGLRAYVEGTAQTASAPQAPVIPVQAASVRSGPPDGPGPEHEGE